MTKIIKPIKIAIDIQSLISKTIEPTTEDLWSFGARSGALGVVTVFSDVFDLYLINKYSNINSKEILRWLKAAQIDEYFREIIPFDENIKEFYLRQAINVTITSDSTMLESTKKLSNAYWLLDVHTLDIEDQIFKAISWSELLREIIKHAWTDSYDFRYNKG